MESDTEHNSIPDTGTEPEQVPDNLEDSDYSEEVKSKPSLIKLEPVEAVDNQEMADIRRVRLQRFNSAPQSGNSDATTTPVNTGTEDSVDTDSATESV